MERDFFSIEEYRGRKLVHYHGHTYYHDIDFGRGVEVCGLYIPVCLLKMLHSSLFEDEPWPIGDLVSESKQYISDLVTEDDMKQYVEGYYGTVVFSIPKEEPNPGILLTLDDVDFDTPCGSYWF